MNKRKKISLGFCAGICLGLSSCGYGEKLILKTARCMDKISKVQGPYELTQGLYDGGITGYWSRGNPFYKAFSKFRQDPKLVENSIYMFGWSQGYYYCYLSANMLTYMTVDEKWSSTRLGTEFKFYRKAPDLGFNNFPVKWHLQESVSDGIPGYDEAHKLNNFFGFFGTPQMYGAN